MQLKILNFEEFVATELKPTTAHFLTATEYPIPHFNIFVRPVNFHRQYWVPEGVDNVIGLWDENADPFCRWIRNGTIEFVQIYHDETGFQVVANTEQGLLACLFEKYYEFLDWRAEDKAYQAAREFGTYIGFAATEGLLHLLDEYACHNDGNLYNQRRSDLIRLL
jgi:hypothetical protein